MASPQSSSQKSKQLADHQDEPREEEKEAEDPPSSIDKRLVDALDDPQYGSTLLHMDSMMQQLITQHPDPYEVYFAPGSTTDLLRLGSILAFHYNLQPYVGRGIRLIAKRTPASSIPAVTLSSISNQRRRSGGTSSGNVSALETAKPENLEKGKDEELVNMSAPVTSTATLEERKEEKASSSLSAHDMTEEKERARHLDERNEEDKLTNPLSNLSLQGTAELEKPTGTLKETKNEEKTPAPVDPNLADVIQQPQVCDALVSNPVSSEVSSSIPAAVMIKSEVVSSSTSAKDPEGGRPAVRPSPSSNQSFKSTTSVNQSSRGTSHQGPVTGHQPQGMQQRGSVSQPGSAPNMLPYGNYIVYNPYHSSRAIYYPVYSEQLPGQQYTQTYYVPDPSITQNTTHASGALNLGYSDYTQVQYPQPIILVSPQHGASTSQPPQPSVQYPQPIYQLVPQQHGASTSQHPRPLVQHPQPVIVVPPQHGASTSQHPRPSVQYPQPVIQVPQQHGASTSQPPRPSVPPQPQRPVRGLVQPIDQAGMDQLLDEHDRHFPDLFSQDAIDAAKADPRPAHEKIAGYMDQEGFS